MTRRPGLEEREGVTEDTGPTFLRRGANRLLWPRSGFPLGTVATVGCRGQWDRCQAESGGLGSRFIQAEWPRARTRQSPSTIRAQDSASPACFRLGSAFKAQPCSPRWTLTGLGPPAGGAAVLLVWL